VDAAGKALWIRANLSIEAKKQTHLFILVNFDFIAGFSRLGSLQISFSPLE
jgi:hypothetical protein